VKQRISTAFVLLGAFLFASFAPNITPPKPYGIRTVVIDAGHGGKDPGCHGEKFKEKDVSLAVALKLGKYIEDNFKDVKVIYTRKTDVFVELNERAAIANRNNADLFICIHCNASPNKAAFGSETYVMGLHKTKGNLDVAKRENSSILMEEDYQKKYDGFDPNSDESVIIFTLYQNAYLDQSLNLASKIQYEYKNKAGRTDKGVKQAGFLVLWKTAMPSLLTEIGFLTNPEDEKFIGSEKGQDYIASSLFRAFRQYKNDMEGKTNVKYDDELENQKPYEASKDSAKADEPKKEEVKKDVKAEEPKKEDKIQVNQKPETSKPETPKSETKKSETGKIETVKSETKKPETAKSETKKTGNVESKSGDPVTDEQKKKEMDAIADASKLLSSKPDESGVYYRVQIASSDKAYPADYEKFKDIPDILYYQVNSIYKYTAGNYREQAPAVQLQNQLRKKGFPDAFVVAFRDGKRIPLNDANKSVKP
jgi:N-acetylmuramoyl-L-alanine amidase